MKKKLRIFAVFFGVVCILGVTGCGNSKTADNQSSAPANTATAITPATGDDSTSNSNATTSNSSTVPSTSNPVPGLDGEIITGTSTNTAGGQEQGTPKPNLSMEDYFKQGFEADKKNQGSQSWSDYWEWVTKFYDGNFMVSGWRKQTEDALQGFSGENRNKLSQRLDLLGRKICAEWAKDNSVRKINSDDLKVLKQQLETGMKNAGGDLSKSLNFVDQKIAEVDAKVGR